MKTTDVIQAIYEEFKTPEQSFKIYRWEKLGLFEGIEYNSTDRREFNEEFVNRAKLIFVLVALNLKIEKVKEFIREPMKMKDYVFEKSKMYRDRILPYADSLVNSIENKEV